MALPSDQTDDFTSYSSDGRLGDQANWTSYNNDSADIVAAQDGVTADQSAAVRTHEVYDGSDLGSEDHEVACTHTLSSGNSSYKNRLHVGARMENSKVDGDAYYSAGIIANSSGSAAGDIWLYRWPGSSGSSPTTLASDTTGPLSSGDYIKLVADGSDLEVFYSTDSGSTWTSILTATDTTYDGTSYQRCGIHTKDYDSSNPGYLKAWSAGTLSTGDATVSNPTPVAATSTVPAPTVATGSTVDQPTTVAATSTVPAPTVATGATVSSPTPVAATSTVPASTVTAGATVDQPATVTAVAAVPTASVSTGTDATVDQPAPVAVSVTVPAATVTGSVTITPGTVAVTATVLASTVATGSTVTAPAPVAATSAVPASTVATGVTVSSPTPVAATSTVPAPTVATGSTVDAPTTVAATTSVPAASVSAGGNATVPAPVVAITVAVPVPTVGAGVTIAAPAPVALVVAVPAPTVSAGTNVDVAAPTVALVATLPAPALSTGSTITPGTVAVVVAVLAASINTGVIAGIGSIVAVRYASRVIDTRLASTVESVRHTSKGSNP